MINDCGLLLAIFADLAASEWIELCLVTQERKGRQLFFSDTLHLLEAAEAIGDKEHCFFGVAPRKNRSGVAESVDRIGVIWADLDAKDFNDDKAAALAAADLLVLPPSYIIDSGHGYHAYWLLQEAVAAEDGCEVVRLVGTLLGGGHVGDPARVMRIPGTFNIKVEPYVPCTVVRNRPELRYKLDDIIAATQISDPTRRSILTGKPGPKARDKTRSGVDWQAGSELTDLQMSEYAMKAIWAEHIIGEKSREDSGRYLDITLKKLQTKQRTAKAAYDPSSCFSMADDAYFVVGIGKRGKHVVSTFTFEPKRLLEGPDEDIFLGDIHADGRIWEGIQLPKSAFLRVDSLMKKLGKASWQWLGTDTEVRFLLPFIMKQWKELGSPRAIATSVLGRHEDYWVASEYTLSATETMDRYSAPIVYSPTGRAGPALDYPPGCSLPLLTEIHAKISKINAPGIVWPILGWFMATPYKPLLNDARILVPHLILYGTTGAGKTATLESAFMPLLGYRIPAHSEDCSTTPFVLLSLLSSTNAVPISLAEFRRSTLGEVSWRALLRTLLLAYDVGHDSRGRPNQTTVDYPLHAPLVLSGEDVISDPAVQRRSIVIGMTPRDIEMGTGAYEAFMDLICLPLSQFAAPYIQYTLTVSQQEATAQWNSALQEVASVIDFPLTERIRRNLATVLFGARSYETFMRLQGVVLEATPAEHFIAPLGEVQGVSMKRGYVLLDSFVEEVINEAQKASSQFVYTLDLEGVLWFHLTTALKWWRKDRLARKEPVLDSAAVKRQLRELSKDLPGEGHYVWGPTKKAIRGGGGSHRMYGLHIATCFELGLDVPDSLDIFQQTITFSGGSTRIPGKIEEVS